MGCSISLLGATPPDDAHCTQAAEPLLRLTLFGQMQAEGPAGRKVLPRSRKTRAVLALLALAAPRPVLRTRLTGLLWSRRAREQGRASLRQAVHELQRALGPHAATLLRADRQQLSMVGHRIWIDARDLAGRGDPEALLAFQLTFLDDLDGIDSAFDAWLASERQRLSEQVRMMGEDLLAAARDTSGMIAGAEKLLSIDRVHEGAWRALIQAHLERGNPAAAQSAYERYSATLSEAGIAQTAETSALAGIFLSPRSPVVTGALRGSVTDRVRLAVLPVRPLGGNGPQDLMPGLAEEITAAVSRFRWISCFSITATASPQASVADYTLDSALQRCGARIRVIIRLLDVSAGHNVVWASRFDRQMDDMLSQQSEIAGETAAQIDPELLLREGGRRLGGLGRESTAYDLTLRAIPGIYRLERSAFDDAGELLAAAVALEPGNAAAHAWWAYWHICLLGQSWSKDPAAASSLASKLAERAMTLDASDARALSLVGHVRSFLHKRPEEARVLHERALSLNPHLALAWCFSGLAHSYLGQHEVAIEHILHAQHLSPHDPHAFFFDMALMMPHFLRGELEEALALGRRAVELNPSFTSTYKGYLATLGHLGQAEEASRVLARLLELEPGFTIRSAIQRSPMTRLSDLALYEEGLRRAGLPRG